MRKARGADLAYLATLPPDQARAPLFNHEVDLDVIATARAVAASKREGRRQRQKLPKVRPGFGL
jgi:hypothetical protein